jgi:hypothetical protein
MPRATGIKQTRRRSAQARSAELRTAPALEAPWVRWPDEQLLNLRFCDLDLRIEGTIIENRVRRLFDDLARKNLMFRPHFWLSTDWFTPDGLPGIAVPFYLAHRRLTRLERGQMLEVEGGTRDWCMRLLRHETGHAICNAYRLHRRRDWQRTFGKSTQPYHPHYQPKPYSKRFVLHLDYWYAQSHPSEDFAETFAVWLTPKLPWRKRYTGWPAMQKLEYVDRLMHEIGSTTPLVRSDELCEPLHALRTTLRAYYDRKRDKYGLVHPDFYDRDLRRLFSDRPEHASREPAGTFLRRVTPEIRRLVAAWTGEFQYTIHRVLTDMIGRCRQLRLRVHQPAERTKLEAAVLLTVQTMNFLHGGHHRMVR